MKHDANTFTGSGNLGVPNGYARPGTLSDRLAIVRTVTGTDTDDVFRRAYADVLRRRAFRTLLLRAGIRSAGPDSHRARARLAAARSRGRGTVAPALTVVP